MSPDKTHERATLTKLFGVVTGITGIVLIVGIEALSGIGKEIVADCAIIAAALCFAGAAIFGRSFGTLDPMLPAAGSMLCGSFVLIPISLVAERPWTIAPSAVSVMGLMALSVFSTAFAFVLYFRLVRTLGSVGVTAQAYIRVPIGVGIGVVFLGESLVPSALVGLACVVAGVAAMIRPAPAQHECSIASTPWRIITIACLPSCIPTASLAALGPRRILCTSPTTTMSGACRRRTTARYSRNFCSTGFKPACRGSRSCASAITSAKPSMDLSPT